MVFFHDHFHTQEIDGRISKEGANLGKGVGYEISKGR